MTRKLEEILGLSPIEQEQMPEQAQELVEEAIEIQNNLSIIDKIDTALTSVSDLDKHDKEMDEIAQLALGSYKDLCDLGLNVSDAHTARLFEVAGAMLKTALDARDAKVNRKLKTIDLQLKKARLDKDINGINPATNNNDPEYDRNELLSYIKAGIKEANVQQTNGKENDK